MNIHNKLRQLGFKKTQFYKVEDDDKYIPNMVPDNLVVKYEYLDGKYIKKSETKIHPKSDSFWKLKYNQNFILWALINNHRLSTIWLENVHSMNPNRITTIYNVYNKENKIIGGKNDIINILPKELKRDFLLRQLFN